MAKISAFMYSENIQMTITPQGVKPIIIGPVQVLNLAYIPGTFSFSVVVGLQEFNISEAHAVKIVFKNPSGDIMLEAVTQNLSDPTNNNAQGFPDGFSAALITMDFRNIAFEHEGRYSTDILFNDELLGTFPVYVALGKVNEQ